MSVELHQLTTAFPNFRRALRQAELAYARLRFTCPVCQTEIELQAENEHTKGHVLSMLRRGLNMQQTADKLQITYGRVAAYKRRAGLTGQPRPPVLARPQGGFLTSEFTSLVARAGFLR